MSEQTIEASYVTSTRVPNSDTTEVGRAAGQSITMSQAPVAQAFRPGTLYAILLYLDESTSWHWALFLPYDALHPYDSESELFAGSSTSLRGMIWHCTNRNPNGRWAYEELTPDALDLPSRLVLAARLADLASLGSPPDVAAALSLVLSNVPVRAEAHKSVFNGRTWMLDGIGELDDGGFLSCVSTMALERELVSAALLATPKYEEDGSYVMITPRNCSDN